MYNDLVQALSTKFVEEIKVYQQAQQEFNLVLKTKVRRQVRTVIPKTTKVSDEHVDTMIADMMSGTTTNTGGTESFFKEQILQGKVNDKIMYVFFLYVSVCNYDC